MFIISRESKCWKFTWDYIRVTKPLSVFRYPVDHDRDRPVARHVASRPETVHGDVERDDQRLHRLVKAKHILQDPQSRHDRTTRYARSRHHSDAQHHDKTTELGKLDRLVRHDQDGH